MTGTTDAHADDPRIAIKRTPLALDAQDAITEIEREVIPAMLGNRLEHFNAELDGVRGDLRLGHRTLVIGRVHEHMFARDPDGEGRKRSRMCDGTPPSV
jgi:hypothetical protein